MNHTMICLSLFQFIPMLWLVVLEIVSSDPVIPTTRPGCNSTCEDSLVDIPFPFGIGPGCYHDPWYEIVCNSSSGVQKPFLSKINLEVLYISSDLQSRDPSTGLTESPYDLHGLRLLVVGDWQTICTGGQGGNSSSQQIVSSINLKGSPFRFAVDQNALVMLGCPGYARLVDQGGSAELGGCSSVCQPSVSISEKHTETCDGIGCCSAPLSAAALGSGIDFYNVYVLDIPADTCIYISLMDITEQGLAAAQNLFRTVLYWRPPPLQALLKGNISNYQNTSAIVCFQDCNFYGDGCTEICMCTDDHIGNPYLPYGCRDSCTEETNHSIRCKKAAFSALLGLSISFGSLILMFCAYGGYRFLQRRSQIKQRAKFFKRNGGLLLQQQMASPEDFVDRTKVFTSDELEKATNCFDASRVLGQGGQGTVYKGMLLDGRIVAIKKSKKVDESQLQHFINEVVVLSQINHRNVVRLLGCCLETQVPLLVYEYIPNGTLAQHIHNPSEDFHITWKMRLQIAAESAGAIAYLHSSSAIPIYHRDIKSSNILLDEQYRAKVSDFGISRTIKLDQTHLTTSVQGTFGYLDPEYFRSNHFTEKSDVYSFGVVLIELLTSKKPLSSTDSGGCKSLAVDFIFNMERSCFFDMLDTQVVEEAKEEELIAVANLAMQCLNINAKQRPRMKEVSIALEGIRSPNPPSAVEQTHLKVDDVAVEMSFESSSHASSSSFFYSDIGAGTSYSIEIQPLVHNTG